MQKRGCSLAPIAAKSRSLHCISFDGTLPCWAEDDCIVTKHCWIKGVAEHTLFVELVELFVLTSLPCTPIGEGFEFPLSESAEGLFLGSG